MMMTHGRLKSATREPDSWKAAALERVSNCGLVPQFFQATVREDSDAHTALVILANRHMEDGNYGVTWHNFKTKVQTDVVDMGGERITNTEVETWFATLTVRPL